MVDFSFGFFEMALSSASLISCCISLTLFFDTVWSKNSITCIVAVSLCEWWILKRPAGPFVIPFGSDRSKRIPPWAHMLRTLRTVSMYCSKTAVCFTPKYLLIVTAREMAGILGITLRQCERILASLKQKGLIARVGANKGGHWKIRL